MLTAAPKPNYLNKKLPVTCSFQKSGPPPASPKSPQQQSRPASFQTFAPIKPTAAPSTNNNYILAPTSPGVLSKPLSPLSHLNTSQPPFNNNNYTSYSPSIASTTTYSAPSKSPLGWAHVDSPQQNRNQYQPNYYQTPITTPPFELTSNNTSAFSEQPSDTYFGQPQVRSWVSRLSGVFNIFFENFLKVLLGHKSHSDYGKEGRSTRKELQ